MEINSTDRAAMVLELVQKHLRTVVKQVDGAVVERSEDPGSVLVEG
jgi:hypothetical protein